jgi:anti-anti-sigma factor
MAADASAVTVATGFVNRVPVLTLQGVLDTSTYQSLRDEILKIALDEPRAVIVDVSRLDVPDDSAWAVFTKTRWQVSESPNVPIALVCEHLRGRQIIRRNGTTRYVPVYRTIDSALDELPSPSDLFYRQRARAQLPSVPASAQRAQELTTQWLKTWEKPEFIPTASVLAAALVEHALAQDGEVGLCVECDTSVVTVAVETPPRADDHGHNGSDPDGGLAGLVQIAAMSRSWGKSSTPSGTTVWAIVVPEEEL